MSESMAVLDRPMAPKKTGRPKTSERDDVTIKADRDIVAKLRYAAERQRIPLAQLVSDLLRQAADREFDKASRGD